MYVKDDLTISDKFNISTNRTERKPNIRNFVVFGDLGR